MFSVSASRSLEGTTVAYAETPRPVRDVAAEIRDQSCFACSGDYQPRAGEAWPGHDRACCVGLGTGSTAVRREPLPPVEAPAGSAEAQADHAMEVLAWRQANGRC